MLLKLLAAVLLRLPEGDDEILALAALLMLNDRVGVCTHSLPFRDRVCMLSLPFLMELGGVDTLSESFVLPRRVCVFGIDR